MYILLSFVGLVVLVALIGAIAEGLKSWLEVVLFVTYSVILVILFHIIFLGGYAI